MKIVRIPGSIVRFETQPGDGVQHDSENGL
jgi:hypothetical protein